MNILTNTFPNEISDMIVEYILDKKYWMHPVDVMVSGCMIVWNENMILSEYTADIAARFGYLDIVKFAHSKGCIFTTDAMNWAACYNHLPVVEFLYNHRKEGCTTDVMDLAAENGNLEIVKFLYENIKESHSTEAFNRCSEMGHIEVAKYLYEKQKGYCNIDTAIKHAYKRCQNGILTWLIEMKESL